MIQVRMPRVLTKTFQTGSTILQEKCRLNPLKVSAEINLDTISTSQITLDEKDEMLKQHDFVEVYGARGSFGIFRVVDVSKRIRSTRTYQLNHAFDTFSDCVIEGTETISGTVSEILQKLVNSQKEKIGNYHYWQLGTVQCSGKYSFDNMDNNVLEEMWNIAEKFKNYCYSFDFSTFPWTLNFIAKDNTITGELRLNRNIDNIEINETDKNQCTRLYLSIDSRDDPNIPKSQQTVTYRTIDDSTAIAQWGVIEKAQGIETKVVGSDEQDIQNWIDQFMNEHKNPELSISIDGEEYERITGEPKDKLTVGRLCATILSEYQTIFHERVVSQKYPDVLRIPLHYTASLANKKITAGGALAKLNKKVGGGGRKQKQLEKDISYLGHYIDETDQHWQSVYWDTYNGLTSRIEQTASYWQAEFDDMYSGLHSFIEATAEHWQAEFSDSYNGLVSLVEQTAQHWTSELADAYSGLSSKVEQTAAYWRSDIDSMYSGLSSRVEQTESSWSSTVQAIGKDGKITAGTIALAINNSTGESEARIDANKVYIGNSKSTTVIAGKTTLAEVESELLNTTMLNAKIGNIPSLSVQSIAASGTISAGTVNADNLRIRHSSGSGYSYSDLQEVLVSSVELSGPVDNVYTLSTYNSRGQKTLVGTFNRATTQLTAGWSGGTFDAHDVNNPNVRVTTTLRGIIPSGEVTKSDKFVLRPFSVQYGSDEEHTSPTGFSQTIAIDASSVYNDGAPVSGTAGGRHGTAYDWDFVITKGDGTTKAIQIDCSAIYSDARVGYTQGTFTRKSIVLQGTPTSSLTLQGAAATKTEVVLQGTQTSSLTLQGESQTVYEEVSSGGTLYYTAGSPTTYYNEGTTTKVARGESVTVTLQGSQTSELTLQGAAETVFEEVSSGGTLYYTAGTSAKYHKVVSSGGTLYYKAGTAVTRYKGDGSTVTGRGSSVSVIPGGNLVRFKRHTSSETPSGTWYSIVSSGGDISYRVPGTETTYYKGDGSTVTGRGTSESITPIGSTSIRVAAAATITPVGSTSKRLSSVTRYKAGTNVGKLYNAGDIATYYKGNGGSFTVQGSSVSVTPIGSTSKRLSSVTRYKAGTNVGKLYNQGTIAEYYPATQTLYKAGTNVGVLYNAGTISNDYYLKS